MPDPAKVRAHTSGLISRHSAIKVQFVNEYGAVAPAPLPSQPISLDPPVKGQYHWEDGSVLVFSPDAPLERGHEYRVTVDAGPGIADPFDFMVAVPKPVVSGELEPVSYAGSAMGRQLALSGVLATNDREEARVVEQALAYEDFGGAVTADWTHSADGREHRFTLKGLARKDAAYAYQVAWDSSVLGGDSRGTAGVTIPAAAEFSLLSAQVVKSPQYCVELVFSDPLDASQDLRGLVLLDGQAQSRYVVENNRLKLFPQAPLASEASLRVEPDIRNESRRTMAVPVQARVAPEPEKPAVRFVGTGVVVPGSQGFVVPIETMNLRAVTVQAFRVYGDNMGQFLQVNELAGNEELNRVGVEVWRKEIPLDWKQSMTNSWIRTGLDLGNLLKDHPDGLFRLQIAFGPAHVVYPGAELVPDPESLLFPAVDGSLPKGSYSYWDYYEDEGGYHENYLKRLDPAHRAYYMRFNDHNIAVNRNFMFTNLGISARQTEDNAWFLAVTDLKTAKPVKGATVSLNNFVRQTVASGETDQDGLLVLHPGEAPYVAEVRLGSQKNWLKLSDGQLLPVSSFDVSGEKPGSGVRGFIYGERGVWRPGDDIHASFILFDPLDSLPQGHPVVLEFSDPQGRVVENRNLVAMPAGSNFYACTLNTPPDAPTGDWSVRIMVGSHQFSRTFKVETIKPNRLKIDLKFDGSPLALSGTSLSGTIAGAWLHGAPAPGLKADLGVRFVPVSPSFGAYKDYVFDDPSRTLVPESQQLFSTNLGDTSSAAFTADIEVGVKPSGMLRADFLARIYEDEGTWSAEQFSMPYHYYQNYVGLQLPKGDEARGMLLTDTDQVARLAMVDQDGKPVNGRVQLDLFKIEWRWWWEKGEDNLAQYTEVESSRLIQTGSVDIRNGQGEWKFQVKYPDWGRYMVRVRDLAGGHSAAKVVYIDWPGWAGRARADGQGSAQVITLSADKPAYTAGETVVVSFPSAKDGQALVSLESKGRIIRQQWVPTAAGTTRWQFKAGAELAPNCYVHVTYLQPHLQTMNDLPLRLHGILPVLVKDPETSLDPRLQVDETIYPNSLAKVQVSEARGRPMTYTLAMVDEGLLGLTRFKVPNPWGVFYSKEASRLKTWDMYQLVAGAFGGKLSTLLAVGGSDDGLGQAGEKPSRFKPVVAFLGPFSLEAGASQEHEIPVPAYMGAVRFMVVAGSDRAFGATEKTALVKTPLITQTTLPRVLGVGETVEIPVRVFVDSKKPTNVVSLSLALEGGIKLDGPASIELPTGPGNEATARFRIQVGEVPGLAKVTVSSLWGTVKGEESFDLEIRVLGSPVNKVVERLLQPGERWNEQVAYPGAAGTNSVRLEVSNFPPIDMDQSLNYLIAYPYGCVEQTTSSVFPQLYLDDVTTLDDAERQATKTNVGAGIERLRQFQTMSGGFSYWPGEQAVNDWGTSYAGHFLIEARNKGYAIPPKMLDKWYDYQKTIANSFTSREGQAGFMQAYRLYTLALYGKPDLSAMNRLKESAALSGMARWRLAAAYIMAAQPVAASGLFQVSMLNIKAYRELDGTYGSEIRDKAIALETLLLLKQWTAAEPLVKDIARSLTSGQIHSTQTTAYALVALMAAARQRGGSELSYNWQWNGSVPRSVKSLKPYVTSALDAARGQSGSFNFSNTGTLPLSVRLVCRGIPLREAPPVAENGLHLEVSYQDASGKVIDPQLLVPGNEISIRVKVSNTGNRNLANLALNHLLPGAWEVVNTRLVEAAGKQPGADFDYQDIRDDRIYTFFRLNAGETKTFAVRVIRSFAGRFWLPAIRVEAMYDPSIQSATAGRWLEPPR